ncbi:MAG: hypothetical protein PHF67_05500 [Candidatus Nanoarchaeia archaeon]|nr:hypothetical protein [Candidatus Nanoarchaeia archaeon]
MATKKSIGFILTIIGGLLILALSILKLLGTIELSSDWFWLILGLIIITRAILTRK